MTFSPGLQIFFNYSIFLNFCHLCRKPLRLISALLQRVLQRTEVGKRTIICASRSILKKWEAQILHKGISGQNRKYSQSGIRPVSGFRTEIKLQNI